MAEREGRVQHAGGGVSRTKQSDAAGSDVNQIMTKWIAHGIVPPEGPKPQYGDFSGVDDFHTAMNKVRQAEQQFEALPAAVRAHVNHDPGKFLEMVYDPERVKELEELGLVPERIPEEKPAGTEPTGEDPPPGE